MTAEVTQTRARGRKTQTNFGLTFNFRPGVLMENRASPTQPKLNRHDFVNRDYSLPLVYKGQNVHLIHLIADYGSGLYRFKVTDGFGRVVKNQPVRVTVKDSTVSVIDPGTVLERGVFLTNSEGEYLVLYQSPSGQGTQTQHQTTKGQGSFNIVPKETGVTPSPPTPPEPPVDPVYNLTLLQSQSPDFIFALTNKDGEPVPNHQVYGLVQESAVGLYFYQTTSLATEFLTDQNGHFGLSLGPALGYPTANLALTPAGGQERLFPLPLPHSLTLTADPLTLEKGVATLVNFNFAFNGNPLPSGTLVELTGPYGAFTGLPWGSEPVGSLGVLSLANLIANNSGHIAVSGSVRGYSTGEVVFTVTDLPEELTLTVSPTTINYGENSRLTLNILKNGAPIPVGSAVTVIPGQDLAVAPLTYTVTTLGELTLDNVQGLSIGQTTIAVSSGVLESQPASITVVAAGTLTLRTLTPSLEFLAPTEVILVAELNGQPLPSGVEVTLDVAPGLKNAPVTKISEPNGY
jgi:hypothetical protein